MWSKAFVCIYYAINKQYIATQLCENKDKPQLKCDGKCHLRTMLQQTEQQQEDNEPVMPKIGELHELTLFVQALPQLHAPSRRLIEQPSAQKEEFFYQAPQGQTFVHPVFHPPQLPAHIS